MTWQIAYPVDGKWEFGTREFADPQQAICALVFELGIPLHSEQVANGSWEVKNLTGATVACIRELRPQPSTVPGTQPQGSLGPLRRWRGLTWVGWLNYLFLRWFLFRIAYTVEENGTISRYQLKFHPTWRW